MSIKIISEATSALVDSADFKRHAFIYDTDEDTYIDEILLAAQQDVAQYIGEYPSETTVRFDVLEWNTIVLPHRHVSSVDSVSYYDTDNSLQTLSASNYIVDDSSADVRIKFVKSFTRPPLSTDYSLPIQVQYKAHMQPASDTVRQAIRIVAGEMYQSRSLTTSSNVQALPLTVMRLLQDLRRY